MLGVCLLPFGRSALAEEASATDLRFGSDGTFTILIFSDLQDIQFVTRQIVAGEKSVLADTSADLIVLLAIRWTVRTRLCTSATAIRTA